MKGKETCREGVYRSAGSGSLRNVCQLSEEHRFSPSSRVRVLSELAAAFASAVHILSLPVKGGLLAWLADFV